MDNAAVASYHAVGGDGHLTARFAPYCGSDTGLFPSRNVRCADADRRHPAYNEDAWSSNRSNPSRVPHIRASGCRLLVIDDGSKDDTWHYIERAAAQRRMDDGCAFS